MAHKLRVLIVDVRNGQVFEDGSNINAPIEGQVALKAAIEDADILVEISADNMFVKRGVERGNVTLVTTKTEAQMSLEKADREREARNADKGNDDLQRGDHPLKKMNRIWDESDPDYVQSGTPEERGLKGY